MEDLFDGSRKDSLRLQMLGWGDKLSAVFIAAIELGLFTKVSQGAHTLADIARALDITELNARRIVETCAAMDLLRCEGDAFVNAPDVERYLVEGRSSYQGAWFQWWRKKDPCDWNHLADSLRRTGPTRVLGEEYVAHTVEDAREFHEGMFAVGMGAAHLFHRSVDVSQRKLILDLGGGSGHYCIVAAQKYPEIRGIIFDLPPVVEVTREYVAQCGQSDRISAQAGDFTRDPYPPGADVVLFNGNGTQYAPEMLQSIIRKAYEAMAEDGEMHIIFEMMDDDRAGPVNAALFGLFETFMSSQGQGHSAAEVKRYMEAAGFVDVGIHNFIDKYIRRVTGYKRAG